MAVATDLFGRRQLQYGGSFAADAAIINFSFTNNGKDQAGAQTGWVGLLVQQISVGYNQRMTRAYELGSQKVYFIVGRPQGQFQMQRLVGPSPLVAAFYYKFGNACCVASNIFSINAAPGCAPLADDGTVGANGGVNYQFDGVLITGLQLSIQAENMVISESLVGEFVSATLPGQANTVSCGSVVSTPTPVNPNTPTLVNPNKGA